MFRNSISIRIFLFVALGLSSASIFLTVFFINSHSNRLIEEFEKRGNIAVLELLILVLACSTWGRSWSRKRIRIHSDNYATVKSVEKRHVKDLRLMSLLRSLHAVEAEGNFLLSVVHIPGKLNVRADAISREWFGAFRCEHHRVTGSWPNVFPTDIVYPNYDWTKFE